jgi:hypothetical protein
MQDHGSGIRRIHLLRGWVNKDAQGMLVEDPAEGRVVLASLLTIDHHLEVVAQA